MFASIDCMHWIWKNCPMAYQGQYKGKEKHATIVLEAIASYDLWIWHCFFGLPGTMNDINVLDRSPLVAAILHGTFPKVPWRMDGKDYEHSYFLGDGIYPDVCFFVFVVSLYWGSWSRGRLN